MRTWVFNNNDPSRRGVWHLPAQEIEWEHIDAKVTEEQEELNDYHKGDCQGQEDYSGSTDWRQRKIVGCTCGLGDTVRRLRGHYTEIRHYPGYTQAKDRIKTLCNQVTISNYVSVEFPWKWSQRQKYEVGSVHHETGVVKYKTFTFEGDQPPGPTCSRCLKKAEVA